MADITPGYATSDDPWIASYCTTCAKVSSVARRSWRAETRINMRCESHPNGGVGSRFLSDSEVDELERKIAAGEATQIGQRRACH